MNKNEPQQAPGEESVDSRSWYLHSVFDYKKTFLILICFLLVPTLVHSACPNNCFGRGYCTNENKCMCPDEYIAADCSQLVCPKGPAWADKAYAPNQAHSLVECSSQGLCDRTTGKCMCFDGYDGDSCQRQSCNCNNRGTCINIGIMYKTYSPMYNATSYNSTYSNWDADHTTSCICDWGYTGASCEFTMCPKGIDPLTFYADYRAITIRTTATGGILRGQFKFIFNGQFFYFTASARKFSADQCQAAFEALPNIGNVKCTRSQHWDQFNGATYAIQFRLFPVIPSENNIFYNSGDPPLNSFHCGTELVTSATGPSCVISDVAAANKPVYAYCSNRGRCDLTSGVCTCFADFTNTNCNTYFYGLRAVTTTVNADILSVQTTTTAFTGNVLKLSTTGIGNTGFDMIKVSDERRTIFSLDGYGNLDMFYGALTLWGGDGLGGMTIAHGGLTVTGGLTIFKQGLQVSGGITISSGGLRIPLDGIQVTGGMSVNSGGLTLYDGVTVLTGGLRIYSNGLLVSQGGATVSTGGLFVESAGNSMNLLPLYVPFHVSIYPHIYPLIHPLIYTLSYTPSRVH